MAKRPYMKLWKSDFRDGAKALTRPAKLLYFEILMLLDDNEGSIPDDVHWIRLHLGMHDIRQVAAPLEELKRTGKLTVVERRIVNERMTRDHAEKPKKPGGSGGGGQGGGTPPLLRAIAGGRRSSTDPVCKTVDEAAEVGESVGNCAPTVAPLRPHCRQWIGQAIDFTRLSEILLPESIAINHRLLLSGLGAPRARDGPRIPWA